MGRPAGAAATHAGKCRLIALGVVRAAIHLFVSTTLDYGYSSDELYFLDSTDRLVWGFVDHPPLSVAALAAVRWVLGDSLLAVRVVPSLLGGATVVLGGLLARELGGGRAAQVLSALTVLAWPPFLGNWMPTWMPMRRWPLYWRSSPALR